MRPIPAPSAGVLYTGTALIGAAVVAGTLMYDYRGRVNALVVPFIGGAVLTVFAVALTVAFFPYAAVVQHFWYSAADRPLTAAGVSIGGMIVGAVAGLMLGTQIGGTIAIHRVWTSLRPRRG